MCPNALWQTKSDLLLSKILPFWRSAASFHLSVSLGGQAIWWFWLPAHTSSKAHQICTTLAQVQHVIIETGVQERDEAAWRPWQTSLNFLNRSTWKDEGHVDINERSTNVGRKCQWKAALVTFCHWLEIKINASFNPSLKCVDLTIPKLAKHQNLPTPSVPNPIRWALCHIYARLGRSWCLKWSQSRHHSVRHSHQGSNIGVQVQMNVAQVNLQSAWSQAYPKSTIVDLWHKVYQQIVAS